MSETTLKDRIADDLKRSMKARDQVRLDTLRGVKARIQEKEVERRAKEGLDYALDDDGVLQVLAQAAKQRRDSIDSFRGAGRTELAEKEEAELAVIQEYLPRPLGDEELERMVRASVEESGAASLKEMGKVMKTVMPKVRGRADGKRIQEMVRKLLGP